MKNISLFLCFVVIAWSQLFSQVPDIVHLPTQNHNQSITESTPIVISENEILILYVNPSMDTIYSTYSDVRGESWGIHKIVQTVQLEDQSQELLYLSALKTNSGRLILSW